MIGSRSRKQRSFSMMAAGEMYFCNLRCFCIWAVQIATKPKLSDADKDGEFVLKAPEGEEHRFSGVSFRWRCGLRSMRSKSDLATCPCEAVYD